MERSAEIGELIALIDRLEALLDRSALAELEVASGSTTLVLRKPSALAATAVFAAQVATAPAGTPAAAADEGADGRVRAGLHAVTAPLTGVFYHSPSPGAAPYVRVGGEVNAGQVIGLIEAMKLFNEIKSDVSGTVRHIAASDGDLVKARQTLIEVDPA